MAFDKRDSIIILFLVLWFQEICIPNNTVPSSFLCTCVSVFLFQATKEVLTRAVGEDGRPLLNFIMLWQWCLNCCLYTVKLQRPKHATRTTAVSSALRSPMDMALKEISCNVYIAREMVTWWLHLKTLPLLWNPVGTVQQALIKHPLCIRPDDKCWKYRDD